MYRIFAALALTGALAACEPVGSSSTTSVTTSTDASTGVVTTTTTTTTTPDSASGENPLIAEGTTGIGDCDQPLATETQACTTTTTEITTTASETGGDTLYANEASDDLTVNDIAYDATTGEVVFNNVPFDGDDNVYTRNAAVTTAVQGASGTTFDIVNNTAGFSNYYAVFRRSPNEYSQVGAMGTDRYISYGFGGAGVERLNGDGSLPAANESYVFNGEYAAVRTIQDDAGNSIQYVAGTSRIEVDIEDFDNIGAVEGIIANRRFFDANGVEITSIAGVDYIALATAEINFDDWTITSTEAALVIPNSAPDPNGGTLNAPSTQSQTGTWDGLFAGPNGEEISGFVFVEGTGPIGIDVGTGTVLTEETIRETGVFTATR